MITPITTETEWLRILDCLPSIDLDEKPTCVIVPHPDDETLGAGGLIWTLLSKGNPLQVIAVTDGESAYEGVTDLGPIRVQEQNNALERLGLPENNIVRLRLGDSQLLALEKQLREMLDEIIQPNMQVVAPWVGDVHPDHEACGRAARDACRRHGASLLFYFFWTWHRLRPEALANLPLVRFPLSTDAVEAKCDALRFHQSQMFHRDDPILNEDLIAPMKRPFEVFLPL